METEDSILVKCCNLEIVPHNSDTHVELLLGENWDHSSGVNNWIPQIFASAQHIVYDLLNFWLMKYWSLFGNTEKGKKKQPNQYSGACRRMGNGAKNVPII